MTARSEAVDRLRDPIATEVDRDGGTVDAVQLLGRLELLEARCMALATLLETKFGVSREEINAAEELAIEVQANVRVPRIAGRG